MSQRTMEAHYQPNWRLTQAHGLSGYNCGYAESPGCGTFDAHQRSLVWRLIGDTPITGDTILLDIGCGIGGPAGWIMERYGPRQVIGVEFLSSSVHAARERASTMARAPRFIQGDAQNLPLADGSIDVIFNLESALHYPDKRAFIRECHRVLKPGGFLCLGDITTPHKRLFALAALLNRVPTQFNSNVRLWTTRDYESAFASQGLAMDWHECASNRVADALADGLSEIRSRGWAASAGFRARCVYLAFLEKLLRAGRLNYDLFRLSRM